MAQKTLQSAKKAKADEFYTQLSDIEMELKYYKHEFKGKTVFCNCDDPYESNFFKYFANNFNVFGLKKLIATCYAGSPIANTQLSLFADEPLEDRTTKAPHKIVITEIEDYNNDTAINLLDVEWLLENKKNALTRLKGDGDFRSEECIELLKEADIVVTNPPFSLFREYVAQLMEYDKKFIILGNKNALSYKEIFDYMAKDKMRTGYRDINKDIWFVVPEHYDYEKIVDGQPVKHIMGTWFTNLDVKKHQQNLTLYKRYNPKEFPHYDNYNAINVDKVVNIPYDWDGEMGVPITFLDKYNPKQFEILGLDRYIEGNKTPNKRFKINDKEIYARIIVRRIGDII
ncbi:MAG: adenine-specific methyltransferase EcoRI family protein [Firmicutes bacterium]|nr:adenine-specific methyltransferase EcoRI family protein [Bacillota bacterium]